jgi:uncharacterized membrane protein
LLAEEKRMPVIKEQIDISAAPSNVFRFCHDIDRWPEWDERVSRVELLTTGPIRQGTLLSIDGRLPGRDVFGWEAEYAEFRFPRRSKLQVLDAAPSSPFSGGTEERQVTAAGGGTRFTLTWTYQTRGILKAIADRLTGRAATRRAIRRSLANLKAMIEAG